MVQLFTTIFYQPLLNLLVFLYNVIPGHDIGVAIIVLTILIKLILYPFSIKSIQSQKALQSLQPKIDALKNQYKNEKEKLASAMMKLYKDEKVSPFSSCLPLLIQLPIFITVYQVFRTGLSNGSLDLLYSFVANPGSLSPIAFGFFDLSKILSSGIAISGINLSSLTQILSTVFKLEFIIVILASVSQIVQMRMFSTKKPEIKSAGSQDENMTAIMNKQMMFMMPLLTLFIGLTMPIGLSLYWFVNAIFTIIQQKLIFGAKDKDKNNNQISNPTPINQ